MSTEKVNEVMNLTVANGLIVQVLPDLNHEFLIPTKDVAKGYGVSESTFRKHKKDHNDDLLDGKHFITKVTNSNAGCKSGGYNKPPIKRTYWTKKGVVRMGFFIRSKQAVKFRDWAEDLIINATDSEAQQLLDLVEKAISITGSQNKLAVYMKVAPAVFSHLRNRPNLVSPQMREHIKTVALHIINNGIGVDPELVELLLRVEDKDVRLGLYGKFNLV